MDLTQLANLGEFIGGVAVLVTLIYLVTAVRQTNRTARSTAHRSAAEFSNSLFARSGDPEFAELLPRAHADFEQLNREERGRIFDFYSMALNYYESVYYDNRRDAFDPEFWAARVNRMRFVFKRYPAMLRTWRRTSSNKMVGESFRLFVEEQIVLKMDASPESRS